VGVQEVIWEGSGTVPAGEYKCFYGKGMEVINWVQRNISPAREQLASVFTPNSDNDDDIAADFNAPCQLSLPVRAFTPVEIKNATNLHNPHKAPDTT
jgi:hypothetical protein